MEMNRVLKKEKKNLATTVSNKEGTGAEKRVQYLRSKATGGRDSCALHRMTSVFLHEVNYMSSYISTSN